MYVLVISDNENTIKDDFQYKSLQSSGKLNDHWQNYITKLGPNHVIMNYNQQVCVFEFEI